MISPSLGRYPVVIPCGSPAYLSRIKNCLGIFVYLNILFIYICTFMHLMFLILGDCDRAEEYRWHLAQAKVYKEVSVILTPSTSQHIPQVYLVYFSPPPEVYLLNSSLHLSTTPTATHHPQYGTFTPPPQACFSSTFTPLLQIHFSTFPPPP